MKSTVFVVDDDAAVRDGLAMMFDSAGLPVEAFASAEAFLAAYDPARAGCLVLDVQMPGYNGPQLQQILNELGLRIPVIFLTGYGDVPTSVMAMKRGAVDFLTKPIDARQILERVQAALERDRGIREQESGRETHRQALAALSLRERDVLALAVEGLSNKEIARRLNISHRTVEVHRSRILLKTGASTLLGLARLANIAASAPASFEPPATRPDDEPKRSV